MFESANRSIADMHHDHGFSDLTDQIDSLSLLIRPMSCISGLVEKLAMQLKLRYLRGASGRLAAAEFFALTQ